MFLLHVNFLTEMKFDFFLFLFNFSCNVEDPYPPPVMFRKEMGSTSMRFRKRNKRTNNNK